MVAVAVARRAAEHRDDHMRPKGSHHANYVAEDRVARPVLVRVDGVLRESEVERAREELLGAVDAPCRQQLLGANHTQRFAELVADQILPAVAAREGEIRRLDVSSAGEPRDEKRVLVVGMRTDHQHARVDAERLHGFPQRNRAALLRGRGPRKNNEHGGAEDREQTALQVREARAARAENGSAQTFALRFVGCGNVSTSLTMRACSSACAWK